MMSIGEASALEANDAVVLRWDKKHPRPSTLVFPYGLACFKSLNHIGHFHFSVKTSGRYNSPGFTFFDWLKTVIGNVKNKIIGTYHGMAHPHLPRYLGEFCFRFNRRFNLKRLLESLIYYSSPIGPIPDSQLRLAED